MSQEVLEKLFGTPEGEFFQDTGFSQGGFSGLRILDPNGKSTGCYIGGRLGCELKDSEDHRVGLMGGPFGTDILVEGDEGNWVRSGYSIGGRTGLRILYDSEKRRAALLKNKS